MLLQRHSLVWPTASGWDRVRADTIAEPVAIREALVRWRNADWPLVVRRAEPGTREDSLAVGIALPPHADTGVKPRIAAVVALDQVRDFEQPVSLPSVLEAAPLQWRSALLALHLEAIDTLPMLRLFGSVAWQSITGMRYLRSASDIDLLLLPQTRAMLDAGVALLRRHAATLPLDGEIMFPSGEAVSWKEWDSVRGADAAPASARVLVKTRSNVSLAACGALLDSFDAGAARE